MERCPTQAVLPLVGLAANKIPRDRYNTVDSNATKRGARKPHRPRAAHTARFGDNCQFTIDSPEVAKRPRKSAPNVRFWDVVATLSNTFSDTGNTRSRRFNQWKCSLDGIPSVPRGCNEVPHRQTGKSRFTDARCLLRCVFFERLQEVPSHGTEQPTVNAHAGRRQPARPPPNRTSPQPSQTPVTFHVAAMFA
ncbi:MAG: hypothetical protein R6U98_03075 [Pirellulaceae bacterium]